MQGSSNHELIQAIFPNEIVFAQGKKKYFNRNTFENYEQKTVFHDFIVLCVWTCLLYFKANTSEISRILNADTDRSVICRRYQIILIKKVPL